MNWRRQVMSATWFRLTIVGLVAIILATGIGFWRARQFNVPLTQLPQTLGIDGTANDTPVPSYHLKLSPPTPACVASAKATNAIVAENKCAGTDSWRQTLPLGPANAINAFTVPDSVNIGEPIGLYVSTTSRSYRFSVYRVGWYQEHGARLLYTSPVIKGINQPAPIIDPVTKAASCSNWRDPVGLRIPTSWTSGVYIVRFVTADDDMRYTVFVVRNDASHAPVLFQVSMATYQAYNVYGGRSLYRDPDEIAQGGAARAYAVSFDRPYETYSGLGNLPISEGPYIRFLEQYGYDMSYMSDIDLLQHPAPLTQHKLLIIGGHDEYWNDGMRAAATQALQQGVSIAFFFANSLYWHTRMSDSPLGLDRIIICYKSAKLDPLNATNPSDVTVQWSSPPVNQPQNAVLGESYRGIPKAPAPLAFSTGAVPFFTGTRLNLGETIPDLVGGEIDAYAQDGTEPPNVIVLTSSPVWCKEYSTIQTSDATLYTAPSGAMVFDSGAFTWYLGMNASWFGPGGNVKYKAYFHDMGRFMTNILNAMIAASTVH